MLRTFLVQVIAVTLLPAALVFLMLILNNEELMGKYKNTLIGLSTYDTKPSMLNVMVKI